MQRGDVVITKDVRQTTTTEVFLRSHPTHRTTDRSVTSKAFLRICSGTKLKNPTQVIAPYIFTNTTTGNANTVSLICP
ncbi:unnamed protein product [Soboliphyme baturini]|uniref:Uncharacterized protein n=1 Tax=Soboliphyme baturini TaxID=241478 RepID=A0A183IWF2_9BILA|nr:unnamed protein product [Soboliphyme baturini]